MFLIIHLFLSPKVRCENQHCPASLPRGHKVLGGAGHPWQKDGSGGQGTSLPSWVKLASVTLGIFPPLLSSTTEKQECGERCLVAFDSGKRLKKKSAKERKA